jgi:hypothetical protein
MDTELKVFHVEKPLKQHIVFHERVKLTLVGQFAKDLIQGIVMAQVANVVQGKGVVQFSDEQVVDKACNLAELFYKTAADREMLIDVPSLDELSIDDVSPVGFRVASGR